MNNPSGANQYRKADQEGEDNVTIGDINQTKGKDTRKRSNHSPERVIARLKRDRTDEAQPAEVREKAGFLLAGIERGEVKPHGGDRYAGYYPC